MQSAYLTTLRGMGRVFLALAALSCGAFLAGPVSAQQQQPGSAMPNPRLMTIMPIGGKAGSVVEVTFTGTDLDEPQALLFNHAAIKGELVGAPTALPADPNKKPRDQKADQLTKFKVTIPADAPLGIQDVRLVSKWGISNPRAFVVSDLNEVLEKEPNNDVNEAQRVELNTVVNGVISSPTDVDYFVFTGKKGQRVVFNRLASSIDSRLDATIEVYNAKNKQLAFNRLYQDNDALTDVTLPDDGDYYVRLYHFTHLQATAEYFYRLTISTAPWIDAVYPPVVEPGKPAQLTVYGRNLPDGKPDPTAVADGRVLEKITVTVNVPNDPAALGRLAYSGRVDPVSAGLNGFEYRVRNSVGSSNPFLLTYARASVVLDNGANDTAETAQEVTVPCVIAGRIEKKHDRDWYQFTAKKGEVLSIELLSHRLGAPSDIKFVLKNPTNKQDIIETVDNPDTFIPRFFARTFDPAIYRFTVPADGKYQLLVKSENPDQMIGPRQFYTLRITPEQPDFQVFVMPPDEHRPDGCRLPQDGQQDYAVLATRSDGWNGDITLTVEGLPKGVTCPPQTLASGLRIAHLVLTAAPDAPAWTGEVKIKATATIQGKQVVHEARPASITWPVQPQQQVPCVARLDRNLVLAVRDPAPWNVVATLDKPVVQQGEKVNLLVKVKRIWPDAKTPLTVQIMDLQPQVIGVNNGQPITIAPDKTDGTLPVDVKGNTPPGVYTLVLRTQMQIPFNKDPMVKQKQPIIFVQPSTAVTLTVLPKTVGTVAVTTPNPTVKVGAQSELVVKVTRQFDYTGEFKVQLVLPPNVKGLSAADVVIPAGQDEVKLVLVAPADSAPGPRADLLVRATAMLAGNTPIVQETKITVNVVK